MSRCDLCGRPVRWWMPARIVRPGYALAHTACLRGLTRKAWTDLRFLAMTRDWDGRADNGE